MLIAGSVGFCLVAIFVATGPVVFMTHHSLRHGHVASKPDGTPDDRPRPDQAAADGHGWSVCPACSAVVVDGERHRVAAHQLIRA